MSKPTAEASPSNGSSGANGGRGKSTKVIAIILASLCLVLAWMRLDQMRGRLGAARIVHAVEGSVKRAVAAGQTPPQRVLRGHIELLEKAAELDPTNVAIPISIGAHYFLMQRWPEACKAFEQAAKLEMRGEVFANLARCRLAEGDRPAAMRAIRTAILLDHTQRKRFLPELERQERIEAIERQRANGLFVDGFESGDTSSWENSSEKSRAASTAEPESARASESPGE